MTIWLCHSCSTPQSIPNTEAGVMLFKMKVRSYYSYTPHPTMPPHFHLRAQIIPEHSWSVPHHPPPWQHVPLCFPLLMLSKHTDHLALSCTPGLAPSLGPFMLVIFMSCKYCLSIPYFYRWTSFSSSRFFLSFFFF